MEPKDYPMKVPTSSINGYPRVHDPDHPLANKGGSVYVHRHVASVKIGRWLGPEDVVHHRDGDRSNNAPDNIDVMDKAAHLNMHRHEHRKKHGPVSPTGTRYEHKCATCGLEFTNTRKNSRYCSYECSHKATRRVQHPTKEQLQSDIDSMSWLAVGRKYGVSDNAVRKWARKYKII